MIKLGVPPHYCSICFQAYNNERIPLILVICGHTFCKDCIEMIYVTDTNEIPCPECRQSTFILEATSLPKNRALLDVIIFHEEEYRTYKATRDKQDFNYRRKTSDIYQSQSEINILKDNKTKSPNKTEKLLNSYANILGKLEETYNKILEDHSYLTEISEVLLTKEVDEALDNLIDIVNEYRGGLHLKIQAEFEKVNLIKEFKSSLNMYKSKLEIYLSKFMHKKCSENENNQIDVNNHHNNDVYDKIRNDKKNEEIDQTSLNNVEADIDIRDVKADNSINILVANQFEKDMVLHEEGKELVPNSKVGLGLGLNPKTDDKYSFTEFDIENIANEIKFAELYSITLKHYSKEIYNPCKYFFLNKFQINKLSDDLKKLLQKICDFDENVHKFNIESLNSPDEKKLLKEIQEACSQSNYRKLKFIFTHLRINPNFIYSEILDHLSYQGERDLNNNTSNVANVGNNLTINLAGSANGTNTNTLTNNSTVSHSNNIFAQNRQFNQSNLIRLNNNNRIQGSSFISNMNFKDKITNLYSCLKNFKDKNELSEFLKFLIEEYDYLPLKLEADTSVDIKFGRDFEWRLNLNLV